MTQVAKARIVALTAMIACSLGAAISLGACGGVPGDGRGTLTVSAASSLRKPLEAYVSSLPGGFARFQFGGSDTLAAAIAAGQRPDVFIAASGRQPAELASKGLVFGRTVVARNRVVIAIPAGSTSVRSLSDLGRPGLRVALGSGSVPIGAYADMLIGRLPAAQRAAILANVRTREPDAASVVAKLKANAVDAAITYGTDVTASNGSLRAIALPRDFAPTVEYVAVVIKGTNLPRASEAFIASLRKGAGARQLRDAGFLPATG